jgi:hypothetical protein
VESHSARLPRNALLDGIILDGTVESVRALIGHFDPILSPSEAVSYRSSSHSRRGS